jgi:hypothetical protein
MQQPLAELLGTADARQTAGESAAALELYGEALPQLSGAERARVLFQMAQLARYEGATEVALAHYDELLPLTQSLKDPRAHGLSVAMRGQLIFMKGGKNSGIQEMIRGLAELISCGAPEAEHLTCHTRFLSRRLDRTEFERCVEQATQDAAVRLVLLAKEGCGDRNPTN